MKSILRTTVVLLGAALLLGACAGYSSSAAQPVTAQDFNGLVSALQANGAAVEQSGEINLPYFTVTGQQITVDGAPVQVYQYASEAERADAAALIAPDGYMINGQAIDWADQPTMWANGQLIIIMVGDHPDASAAITTVMGDPFIAAYPME
jgi:hypothetical protein